MPPSALPAAAVQPPHLPLPFAAADPCTAPAPGSHPHLVLPYAALPDASCQHVLASLALPQLDRLLGQLQPLPADEGEEDSPTPPHERAVARAWGLDAAQPAWAAAASDTPGDAPCAWFTPCHWTAGADQVRMDDPSALSLSATEAQALHALIAPWFAEDGLQLDIVTPQRWRLHGTPLAQWRSASLDRVLLRDVRAWLPAAGEARTLQRLHSEVQMLLYTHAFNDARTERGQLPVNAFWIEGAGQLDAAAHATVRQAQQVRPVQVIDSLRQHALRQDWPAWKAAWQAADAGPLAALAVHVAQGGSATLTVCGERQARSFTTAPRSFTTKIKNLFRRTSFRDLHNVL